MFNGLVNLTMVNLTYNRLETFPLSALTLSLGKSIFIGNKSVKLSFLIYADHGTLMLALSENPLECDCEMEWLQRINSLAAKSPRYVHNDMTCHDSMVANRQSNFYEKGDILMRSEMGSVLNLNSYLASKVKTEPHFECVNTSSPS